MLAADVGAVVRGIIVDQLDIRGQSGARVRALDQVVAEQRIARKTPVEHGVQRGHFVDSFAGKMPSPNRSWYASEMARV